MTRISTCFEVFVLLAVASPAIAAGSGTEPGSSLSDVLARTSIAHIFFQGGLIMWPLLIASFISMTVVIDRLLFMVGERRQRSEQQLGTFFAEVGRGNLVGAIEMAQKSGDAVVATLGYGLEHRDQSLPHALSYAENRTLRRYRRGIAVLDTVITLAPLLGLLGTVTGMMGSFSVIGGDVSSPAGITGGIAEALIATAFGLCIAIVTLIPFNYLNNCVEQLEVEMLTAGNQLRLLVEGGKLSAPQELVGGSQDAR
jgi:biopolymer transport protein ExbB